MQATFTFLWQRLFKPLLFLGISLSAHQALAQIHHHILPNGLKILVKEDHRTPAVVTMVWYNIGSSDEPGGLTGVSHALEHMMFKGTPQFPPGQFSKIIAGLGGEENAMTNSDYTAYYEKTAASQLATSFELEADRMQNLFLTEKEFEKEIQVIQEERRLRTDDNPQALTFERYLAAAHLSEPYHHPIIGWMDDLKQMRVEDVRAWYDHFYTPNNAALIVVGDVNPQKVFKLADHYFGKIPKKPDFIRKKQTEPPALGAKFIQVQAPAKIPALLFGYTVPSIPNASRPWEPYALEVLANLLSEGDSARFAKNVVRGRHIAAAAEVYYEPYSRYQTQFLLVGMPAQNHTIAEVKKALLKEIADVQQKPVPLEELQRAKTQIIAKKTYAQDSIFSQAMELGLLETLGLGWQESDAFKTKINTVTPEQIQEVAKRYLNANAITEAQLIPLPLSKGAQ